MVFAHCSGEQGHQKMLALVAMLNHYLSLGVRLGEGTGAALVFTNSVTSCCRIL